MRAAILLARREIVLAWGRGGGPLVSLGFFAALVVILPLAAGPAPQRLSIIAQGAAWAALALALLLSLDRLFERDMESGALDLLALGPLPLAWTCAIKCVAHWLASGVPLALASPLAALALGGPPLAAPMEFATALLGGLAFAFVGGAGAALALSSRRGGVLIALIVLPLIVPPVIFGGAAIFSWSAGLPVGPSFALLAAYTLAAAALCPLAMAGACRNALS
ncbi:MAG: heme exporter protein CcmB [Caulobacteraceae bacterium]